MTTKTLLTGLSLIVALTACNQASSFKEKPVDLAHKKQIESLAGAGENVVQYPGKCTEENLTGSIVYPKLSSDLTKFTGDYLPMVTCRDSGDTYIYRYDGKNWQETIIRK